VSGQTSSHSGGRKRSEGTAISRRTFLGISAGAAAAVTAAYAISWPEFDLAGTPEASSEGVLTEEWIATSCLNCPTRCAVRVRVVNGKAVRIVGNPASSYSDGKTCPRSHVGLQVLYNPERFQTGPLRRISKDTKGNKPDLERDFAPISWDQAIEEVVSELPNSPQQLLLVHGLNSASNEDLIRRFARAYGTPNLIAEDALETDADRIGKEMADGRGDSGYDLGNTNYVLAFGASIVESERPLARNLRLWGKIRRERPNRAKVVVVDPRYSVTAAKADEWVPVNPGTEGALAIALAHVIVTEGLYDEAFVSSYTSGFDAYWDLVTRSDFSPETLAATIGVSAERIRRIAEEFARSKPAIAWSGAGATSWPHGTQASHAIFCLNALVGGIDAPGGVIYQEPPPYRDMPAVSGNEPGISFRQVADPILSGVRMAIGINSNLVMSVPQKADWESALKKLDCYVHIGPSSNDMAAYADIILPASTYLEDWGYESALPGSGTAEARIKQPVVGPLYGSRPVARVLFDLASGIGGSVASSFTGIHNDAGGFAKEFVKYRTGSFVDWDEFGNEGVWTGQAYQYAKDNPAKYGQRFQTASGKFEFRSSDIAEALTIRFLGRGPEYGLSFMTYRPVLDIRDGNQNYPWAQEIYLVLHGYGWDSFAEINAETARDLGISDRDWVWVESYIGGTVRRVRARARVFEGILPGVVAMAAGQGHHATGEWADGIGANPNEIIGLDYDAVSGQPSYLNTKVRVYKA
jgi:thiosulfate reductase/polysulfide reductase chain A